MAGQAQRYNLAYLHKVGKHNSIPSFMNATFKLSILSILMLFIIQAGFAQSKTKSKPATKEVYVCLPCGNDCDKEEFTQPGECMQCKMKLVKKSSITFKNIEPTAICAYIKTHPNTILLDVRTKEEFEGKTDPNYGTLTNAINIPVQELEGRLSGIASYKKKDIIVFCSHSHRSPQASYILTQHGFKKVTNMLGGMSVMKDNRCVKH